MDRLCKKCGDYIPYKKRIDGKIRNLKNRKFCLNCSVFNQHNTRDITKSINGKRKSNGEIVTKYRQRLKQKLIDYKGGKCENCGYCKTIPRAYDFHHRDPNEKDFGISSALSLSFDKLKKEVDKCDLLCCRCHAEIHHEIQQKN